MHYIEWLSFIDRVQPLFIAGVYGVGDREGVACPPSRVRALLDCGMASVAIKVRHPPHPLPATPAATRQYMTYRVPVSYREGGGVGYQGRRNDPPHRSSELSRVRPAGAGGSPRD